MGDLLVFMTPAIIGINAIVMIFTSCMEIKKEKEEKALQEE